MPLEVRVLLRARDGSGKSAPDAVGPVPIAWEADDGPEDVSVIPVEPKNGVLQAADRRTIIPTPRHNPAGRQLVQRTREYGPNEAMTPANRIDQDGDNCPTSCGGFRAPTRGETIKRWFPAGCSLAPCKVARYAVETRDGVEHHRAIIPAHDPPCDAPRRGRSCAYLRLSTIGGDDCKVRVALSFDGLEDQAALEAAHADVAPALVAEGKRWTTWRRTRYSLYCPMATPMAWRQPNRSDGLPDWSMIADGWKQAFIQLENELTLEPVAGYPTRRYEEIVTEDIYKATILALPANRRPPGVRKASDLTYRKDSIYGGKDPLGQGTLAQGPRETAQAYQDRVAAAIGGWCGQPTHALMRVILAEARKKEPEGYVVWDKSTMAGPFTVKNFPGGGTFTHAGMWGGGEVHPDGAVTMHAHQGSNIDNYVLHESGHARFLYHHVTNGGSMTSDNPRLHDAHVTRCAMSYTRAMEGDSQPETLYPFCGVCIMRLRGWDITKTHNDYK
jgi:hypothetical protein